VMQLAIGLPLGIGAARHQGRWLDRVASVTSSVFVATPVFLLGLILLELLAFQLRVRTGLALFPIGGYQPLDLRTLVLPAFAVGLVGAATYVRIVRTVMVGELGADYVRTARAKGVSERGVSWHHAFRNALPPVLAQVGLDLGAFLGGLVIVEQVFSWPGVGKLAVDSIVTGDVPLIMGTVLFATLAIVLANLAVDIAMAVADPRIRY
jgi:peptide/nickel transport system permease protein